MENQYKAGVDVKEYEANQNADRFISWVHRQRFRHVLNPLRAISGTPKVLEIGCAHGKLLETLQRTRPVEFFGVDLDAQFIEVARANFPQAKFITGDAAEVLAHLDYAPDIVYALETLEHVPWSTVTPILKAVARMKPRQFVCSVPVEIGPAVWMKNLAAMLMGYERYKEYTFWQALWTGVYRLDKMPQHCGYHVGFDWRALVHSIRQEFRITQIRTLPLNILPTGLAVSVFITAEPYS